MTDLALHFDNAAWSADLAILNADLATDDGLRTAVIISLFTDRRALADDVLPVGDDRRGWWGDCANDDPNDRIGSRRWLLVREKATEAVAVRARDYDREALAWLVADGIAAAVTVECSILPVDAGRRSAALHSTIRITRPSGARLAIDYLWDAESVRILDEAA